MMETRMGDHRLYRMEVLHISCNMGIRDLPDMYALSPRACGPRAPGIYIRQIPRAHVTTYTCTTLCSMSSHPYYISLQPSPLV